MVTTDSTTDGVDFRADVDDPQRIGRQALASNGWYKPPRGDTIRRLERVTVIGDTDPLVWDIARVPVGAVQDLTDADGDGILDPAQTRDRDFVNVNLSRLSRIDFVCAANLGNTVSALCDLGKTVRLIKPNLLVATLLKMLKIDERAAIIVAKPAT